MFTDRSDAGIQLAQRLKRYADKDDTVVLAMPRGGVVLGYEIANALRVPLDIVVTRKIGHPANPEYAICAVDEKGTLLCNEEERRQAAAAWLTKEAARQQAEAVRRSHLYRGNKAPSAISGKNIILTDDGVATGLSIRLAVEAITGQAPARLVIAVPVAPAEIIRELKKVADEVIVLLPPEEFAGSVGAHYEEFPQVEDDEVIRLLKAAQYKAA